MSYRIDCSYCDATGKVTSTWDSIEEKYMLVDCPRCGGRGYELEDESGNIMYGQYEDDED